jgi:predicted RNA binding protein YcfA (HicA-like mRNA interferase family)
MPSLPTLRGRDVVRVLQRFGWQVVRQSSSHIIMVHEGSSVTLSIPDHREVAKGTLRSLIRAAQLSLVEFVAAVQNL